MKYIKKKDREIILNCLEKTIRHFIHTDLLKPLFLCTDLQVPDHDTEKIVLSFIRSEKPTKRKNAEFFNHKLFCGTYCWWDNDWKVVRRDFHTHEAYRRVKNKEAREQRILFLQMLVDKIEALK